MSVTALTQTPQGIEPLLLHEENLFADPENPAAPTGVRRFPPAFRPTAAGRSGRCMRPGPGTAAPPSGFRSPAELEGDFQAEFGHDFDEVFHPAIPNPAAQAVADRMFPPCDALLAPAESVAAVVHAAAPAVLEVLAGARPARQLLRALSPECMLKLDCQMRIGTELRPDPHACCYANPRVLRMRITQVLPLVFEAAVILWDRQKVRATALRIERWHGRWQVTALEIG